MEDYLFWGIGKHNKTSYLLLPYSYLINKPRHHPFPFAHGNDPQNAVLAGLAVAAGGGGEGDLRFRGVFREGRKGRFQFAAQYVTGQTSMISFSFSAATLSTSLIWASVSFCSSSSALR